MDNNYENLDEISCTLVDIINELSNIRDSGLADEWYNRIEEIENEIEEMCAEMNFCDTRTEQEKKDDYLLWQEGL